MSLHILNQVPSRFPDNTYVSLDTEIFRLDEKKLHRPTSGKFACLTACVDPDFVYIITDQDKIQPTLNILDNCVWVMQNAKFDLTHLRRWAKIPPRSKLVDTMLIERILWNGYFDTFSLADLSRRYLDIPLDKTYQKWFADHDELTEEAIHYAAIDASTQLKVWREQKKIVTKNDMMLWKTVDLPALWAVLDFQGFRLDVEAWKQLATINKERVAEIDEDLPLNPRSWQQVLAKLQQVDKRITSTGEKQLRKFLRYHPKTEEAQLVEQILESRKYGTRKSRYGENFVKNMVENIDGLDLVFSDYSINGAETSRMAASGGMHNIPIRDTKEFRKCFIARPGHKLIIADYDSQEARITGYLTQDKRLKEIFDSGEKIYIAAGREIFGKNIKKGSPEYSKMKSTFLGMDYGMTEYGLAQRENITKLEAIELIEKFFHVFPGVERWVERQEKNTKIAYTVLGRKMHLNKYSSQCRNNSLNDPHQGTAADITKRALGYIHKEWDKTYKPSIPFGVVGVFHDEIVLDMPEDVAHITKDFVSRCMVEAAEEICVGIPFKVDSVVADDWSQKE